MSVGLSATLLASVFTVIAASSAMAAVTVTSAGNVPQDGTSAGTATFVLTEQAIASIPTNAAGSVDITILPALPGAGTVTFSGTPVVSAPGSLGASATVAGNVLTVSWTNSDVLNIESITVSGLTIDASATASPGAIRATLTLSAVPGNATVAAFQAGGTASGVLASGTPIGTATALVNVTTTGCAFVATGSGAPAAGLFAFAVGAAGTTAESLAGTASALPAPPLAQQQTLTITTAGGFTSIHNAGDVVTQTNACTPNGVLASPGTVVQAITFDNPLPKLSVFPGENNSPATSLVIHEPVAGFLAAASTFTYTIATAGVVFSTAPTVSGGGTGNEVQTITITLGGAGDTYTLTFGALTTGALPATATATPAAVQTALEGLATIGVGNVTVTGAAGGPFTVTFVGTLANTNVPQLVSTVTGTAVVAVATTTQGATVGVIGLSAAVLSADRKSATVTVTTASTAPATITLSNILYDVAATVPGGTFISVGITTSAGKAVLPPSRTNAVVFRGIVAVSATNPTVYIGENNQAAGLISFTENAAGFFTDGTGSNNTFQICPNGVTYAFTLAPWAKVTGGVAAGNLVLREGAGASPDNIVMGTQVGGCYSWTVWTKSTTASTIQIGNSDFSSGPIINVNVNQPPGAVMVDLFIGSSALATQLAATVQFATATFRNQVTVTALTQPAILAGSTNASAGNIQIAETGLGQLKRLEYLCVEVLPRALTTGTGTIQDTFLSSLNTANLPVATATGSGLLIGPVLVSPGNELCGAPAGGSPSTFTTRFAFQVLQQSTAGDGKVVISNIHYTTTADAVNGPVLVRVSGLGGSPTVVQFQSTISNARIGAVSIAEATINRGLNTRTGFGFATEIVARGAYVTIRSRASGSAPADLVQIWVKTKTTAWKLETSRRVSPNGFMYYSGKVLNLGYRYYRVFYTSTGATSNTVRAYGR